MTLNGDSGGSTNFILATDNGTNSVSIVGNAVAGTLAHVAPNGHTFTGSILPVSDNSTDIGDATNSFQDGFFRTIHLDGATSGSGTISADALSNTLNGNTLTGDGSIETYASIRVRSDHTLANNTSAQPVFPSANDVITLQPNTTYDFYGIYMFTHGTTSHSISMSFPTGGAGSIATINYTTSCVTTAIGTQTTVQASNTIVVATANAVVGGAAVGTETVTFIGTLTTGSGGTVTVTPSITFSADPTGTILTKTDSRIKFTPTGTDAFTSKGPVN